MEIHLASHSPKVMEELFARSANGLSYQFRDIFSLPQNLDKETIAAMCQSFGDATTMDCQSFPGMASITESG
jgi:hypothetical protein